MDTGTYLKIGHKMVNDILNWVWPMNVHWFILLIIAGLLGTIVAWCWTSDGYTSIKGGITVKHPIRTFFRAWVSLFVTVSTLFVVIWCIYACNRPPEVAWEEKLEIKPVVYPNGRVVQMFSCEGDNYNANTMFSSAPPEGSYVRRLVYKRVYVGVYFPKMNKSSSLQDGFFLVTPDKAEQKAINVTPG